MPVPRAPGPAGAADPVDVGFAILGGVEVDHALDLGDVDAAGGDVGRDQRHHLASLEAGQRPLALALALVAVHRDRLDIAPAQALDEPVGAALGADEDERAAGVLRAQLREQVVELGALRLDLDEVVGDVRLGALGVSWVWERASSCRRRRAGRPRPRAWPRRRGSGGRPGSLRRCDRRPGGSPCRASDRPRRGRGSGRVERDGSASDQVLEPAGRGDEDVGAAGRRDLRCEADAAVDGGDAEAAALGERGELVDDLAGELPSGGEDQRLRAPVAAVDEVDQRHAEGERLAGAGGGLDEQVVAGEGVADDHLSGPGRAG